MASENREETERKPRGGVRFKPGLSGNPGGRPKRTPEELELIAACKQKAPAALNVIIRLMVRAKNERVRMDAALAILERGYGKPTQPISTPPDEPMEHGVSMSDLTQLLALFDAKVPKE